MDGSKVNGAFLELACTDGDELSGGKWLGNVWDKEGGKRDVEREKGFDAVCHVERGVASRLASGNAICPECMRGDSGPFRQVAFAGLHDGLSDGAVLAFDNTVGT